jgi:hypothetical protein
MRLHVSMCAVMPLDFSERRFDVRIFASVLHSLEDHPLWGDSHKMSRRGANKQAPTHWCGKVSWWLTGATFVGAP